MPRDIALSSDESDYRAFDRDRSGGLSVWEMARVPDSSVALLLESRIEDGRLTLADAADWLISLNASKAARVLVDMDDRRGALIFQNILHRGFAPALGLLRFSRESFGEPLPCHGAEAAGWLRFLTPEERTTSLQMLGTLEPAYALRVAGHLSPGGSALCHAALDTYSDPIDAQPAASRPMTRPMRSSVDRARTTVVPMRAYAVADLSSREAMATLDVSTCTVLTLYDPIARTGVLAHFDVSSDLHNSLDRIFADLAERGISPRHLVARLAGGNASMATSRRLHADLERRLLLEGVRVAEVSADGNGFSSRAYVLDLSTGTLEAYGGAYLAGDATERDERFPAQLGLTR